MQFSEKEHWSEPSEAIRQYADKHALHLDLRSKIVQHMIVLRMQHPEWREEAQSRKQRLQRLMGQSIVCVDQHICVGRVKAVKTDDNLNSVLILTLADQHETAREWVRHRFAPGFPARGIYPLPPFPFQLSYEQEPAPDTVIDLVSLPLPCELEPF